MRELIKRIQDIAEALKCDNPDIVVSNQNNFMICGNTLKQHETNKILRKFIHIELKE